MRQEDVQACLLFNIILEKALRDSVLQRTNTIYYKSVQVLTYANDLDIIARSQKALEDAFISLAKSARKMGLQINKK